MYCHNYMVGNIFIPKFRFPLMILWDLFRPCLHVLIPLSAAWMVVPTQNVLAKRTSASKGAEEIKW